jgi:hypothetical protein
LVERFCMEIGNISDGGVIVAERRGATLDHELDIAWLNLKIQGTHHMQAKKIERRIMALNSRSKSENIAGLQLADLVVTPIGRFVLGKETKGDFKVIQNKFRRNNAGEWNGIQNKFRRNNAGEWNGYGLVVLPKQTRPNPATQ